MIHTLETSILEEKQRLLTVRTPSVLDRIHARGRLTALERIQTLCDPDTPIWFLGTFVSTGPEWEQKSPCAGVLCALGTIESRQAIIIANDNTVTAGAWWPQTPQKIQRALKTALRLSVPVFYLIECAGLYLPTQEYTYANHDGAGAIFELQAQLNRAGIRQVAAICGDCIAGGGYMPLMCDKIVMTEQATLCIGGTALNAHSKGGKNLPLGTPATHVHHSRCAEARVPNDKAAIQKLREWARLMPSSAHAFFRLDDPLDSPHDIEELYDILPIDPAQPFDMMQVIACLIDGGQGKLLFEDFGPEIITMLAIIDGLPIMLIANQTQPTQTQDEQLHAGSILYQDGITKIRMAVEMAQKDGLPVIWLQDVAGFDIGHEAEKQGLLRHGAMLLHEIAADSIQTPAHLTILLRKASGAGYYAMKGAPFHPALVVGTALTKLEVMSPEILAATMYDRKLASCAQDESQYQAIENQKKALIENQTHQASPIAAAKRGDIDDIIALRDLRQFMITFTRAAWQNGARPSKPPRLWAAGLNLE